MNIKPLLFAILSLNAVSANAFTHNTVSCEQGLLYVTTYEKSNSWHTMRPVWGKTDVVHCDGSQYTLNGTKLTKNEVNDLVLSTIHLNESSQ
jgi:hypothetical protein